MEVCDFQQIYMILPTNFLKISMPWKCPKKLEDYGNLLEVVNFHDLEGHDFFPVNAKRS